MRSIAGSLMLFVLASCGGAEKEASDQLDAAGSNISATSATPIAADTPESNKSKSSTDVAAGETWSCDGSPGPFQLIIKSNGKGGFVSDGSPWGDGLEVTKREDSYIIDGETFGFKNENGSIDSTDMAWFSSETGDPIYCKMNNG